MRVMNNASSFVDLAQNCALSKHLESQGHCEQLGEYRSDFRLCS